MIKVKTQVELDRVLVANPGAAIGCVGSGYFVLYDSVQVRAYDSVQVTASGSAQVTASKLVAITKHSDRVQATGGVQIEVRNPQSAVEWCDRYGINQAAGQCVLYKAVSDDYESCYVPDSGRRQCYAPGTTPRAADWDDGELECGGGLHFSPTPWMAVAFFASATRYVACPVDVSEAVFNEDADYPQKVKTSGCIAPCWEVDVDGNPLSERDKKLAAAYAEGVGG